MSSSPIKNAVVAGLFAGLGWSAPGGASETKAPSGGAADSSQAKAGATKGPDVSHGVPKGSVQCFGANSCKGQNGCAVTEGQIAAANESFGGKFAKSKPISCAGQAACGAKDGFLSWKAAPSAAECFAKGGFMMERKDGKLVVKKS